MSDEKEQRDKRAGQSVALVIAGAMLLWIVAQWAAPKLGLPGRYALLFDFAVIGALVWALIVTIRIWRARRDE